MFVLRCYRISICEQILFLLSMLAKSPLCKNQLHTRARASRVYRFGRCVHQVATSQCASSCRRGPWLRYSTSLPLGNNSVFGSYRIPDIASSHDRSASRRSLGQLFPQIRGSAARYAVSSRETSSGSISSIHTSRSRQRETMSSCDLYIGRGTPASVRCIP